MASQDPLGHLAVMDVTESKENGAAREKLDPRDFLVLWDRRKTWDSGFRRPKLAGGERGELGESATSGAAQLFSHMNWKECTWKRGDGRDTGEMYVSDY